MIYIHGLLWQLFSHDHFWIKKYTPMNTSVLKTSYGKQSRLRRLNDGIPQGSVLAPLLFNIYINDLPDTISRKYGYADDLAILTAHREWKKIESTLSQDLALYLRKWQLTVSTVFHLNNKEAKRDLGVYISMRHLNFQPTTSCRTKR